MWELSLSERRVILRQFWKEDRLEVLVSECFKVQGIGEWGIKVDLFAAE